IAEAGVAVIINTDLAHGRSIAGVAAQPVLGRLASKQSVAALAPADVLVVALEPAKPVIRPDAAGDVLAAVSAPRIVVEKLSPAVAGDPAFAATRIVGKPVRVEADVYTDGHDLLRAELLWRAADEREWRR